METTLLLLLIGFGFGLYVRGLCTKTDAAHPKRHADALNRQISMLQRDIDAMHSAKSRRLDEAARRKRFFEENDPSDVENQIRFISQTELKATRPVNPEAARVLYALETWITDYRPDWRVAFEVAMGAFIKTAYNTEDRIRKAAFSSYNSKRVDFPLIDRSGKPMLVVEYNGTGHDLSDDALDRMKVKRLTLERAKIPLIEIPARTSIPDIVRMVAEKVLQA